MANPNQGNLSYLKSLKRKQIDIFINCSESECKITFYVPWLTFPFMKGSHKKIIKKQIPLKENSSEPHGIPSIAVP